MILTNIRPYILAPDKYRSPLKAAAREYFKEIKSHLSNMKDTNAEFEQARKLKEEIKAFHNQLFSDVNKESLKTGINKYSTEIKSQYKEIENLYTELLVDATSKDSVSTKVKDAKKIS